MNAKLLLFGALMLAASAIGQARAEERQAGYVQVAELDIDPAQLEIYEASAKEQIETAIRVEPGVLALYSVADKNNPSIFEYSKCMQISVRTRRTLSPRILKIQSRDRGHG